MAHNSTKKQLTAIAVRNIKLNHVLTDTGDYSGLRVKRTARGTSFLYRYKNFEGKMKQIRLGVYPEMSLVQAREELQKFKAIRASGKDPQEYIAEALMLEETTKLQQQIESQQKEFTFKVMVDFYLKEKVEDRYSEPDKKGERTIIPGSRKEKGQKEVKRTLYTGVVNHIGDKSVSSTPLIEIKKIIDKIIAQNKNVQAGSVLRELNLAYRFAIANDKLPENFQNPCPEIKTRIRDAGIKITSNKRQRVLSEPEIKLFWDWLPSAKYISPNAKNVMLLSLMTGMRTGEVCRIKWSAVDLDEGFIRLNETKTGASRYVQLSSQAVMFLGGVDKVGEYVFTTRSPQGKPLKTPLDQKQLTQQLYYARSKGVNLDIEPWSPHDLRRTVRTQLSKLRCPREVSEAILGHSKKGIEGTYDLHQYEEEAKEWLQKWCDRLDGIVSRCVNL